MKNSQTAAYIAMCLLQIEESIFYAISNFEILFS